MDPPRLAKAGGSLAQHAAVGACLAGRHSTVRTQRIVKGHAGAQGRVHDTIMIGWVCADFTLTCSVLTDTTFVGYITPPLAGGRAQGLVWTS